MKKEKTNLILIGPRAAGKSKMARLIHKTLFLEVLSTDLLISYEAKGRSIPEIIESSNGNWQTFRDMEYKILKKLSNMKGLLVDTGGGILIDIDKKGREKLSFRKTAILKNLGLIVYLKADTDWIWQKIKNDAGRPSLADKNGFKKMMKIRHIWYQDLADITINTTRKKGSEITQILLKKLKKIGYLK